MIPYTISFERLGITAPLENPLDDDGFEIQIEETYTSLGSIKYLESEVEKMNNSVSLIPDFDDPEIQEMQSKARIYSKDLVYIDGLDDYQEYYNTTTKRVEVSVFNKKLGKYKRLPRHLYNYLVSSGSWDQGILKNEKGYVVHHIDGNKLNDDISNLRLLSRRDHYFAHIALDREKEKERNRKKIQQMRF